MTSRISATFFLRLSAAAATLWLAGCATSQPGMAPEQIVREKAAQRVEAMLKQDLGAVYALTAPSYRKIRSLDTFKSQFGSSAVWVNGEVRNVDCVENRCTVDLGVTVKPLVAGRIGANISLQYQEVWLLEDGKWWLYQGV